MIRALALLLMLTGCVTAERGNTRALVLESTPPGALVTLSTGQSCTSPCQMQVITNNDVEARFTLAGHREQTVRIESVPTRDAAQGLMRNWTLTGAVIDSVSGALREFHPNPVQVTLQRL